MADRLTGTELYTYRIEKARGGFGLRGQDGIDRVCSRFCVATL